MKRLLLYLIVIYILFLNSISARAQAPYIYYNTPVNVYTSGTAITALTPNVMPVGVTVPATSYAQVSNFVVSGTINSPFAITTDGTGNIYVADYGNNVIRKYTPGGVMSVLAGTSGTAAELDGTGTGAKFNGPDGLAYDGAGNLYVADAGGNTIRKIVIATGVVTTYAGVANSAGSTNGALLSAKFNAPDGLTFDSSGNLYVADFSNNLIRVISGGVVSTLAGGGSVGGVASGATDATGVLATFNQPIDLAADGLGNLFVADYANNKIRKIVISTKVVTTLAGGGAGGTSSGYNDATGTTALFSSPASVTFDASGNLLVADQVNNRIRMITTAGVVTTIAGSSAGEAAGIGTAATFTGPVGIETDKLGNCYVADWPTGSTGTVRKMLLTGYTISPALPATLTFTSSSGTISGTPTVVSPATNYTITGYNASGSGSTVISIAVGSTVAWLGKNSSVWTLGTNWSTGSQPGTNDAVSIGVSAYTGSKIEPIITASTQVGSITFGSNGGSHSLTVNSPAKLTIGGYLSIPTTVTPTIAGSGAIDIAPGAIVNITGSGKLTLTAPLVFTLKSDATSSASIGQITTATPFAGTGIDSIRVERYLTGGAGYRGYRLLSSPVYAGTVAPNNVYSLNYLRDDVPITGTSGTTNGFDKAGNPTIYLFREDQAPSNASFTGGNFWGVSNLKVTSATHANFNYYLNGGATPFNLPVGNGFMLFFRGDRTLTASPYVTTTVPVSATLTAVGTPTFGQVVVHDWYTPSFGTVGWTNATANASVRGFNLLGNPYPSSIDWEQYSTTVATNGVYATNVGNTIYVLNPLTSNYDTYQKGGSYTNSGTRTIVSGQGFFVIAANNTSPQLTFNETAKTTSQNTGTNLFMSTNANIAAVANGNNDQHLRLQLAKDAVNTDDVYIGFNSAASPKYVFNEDAPYKPGTGKVSLSSISTDNVILAINKMALPNQKQISVPLVVTASTDGVYSLNMTELKGIPQLFDIWLMDSYKKDSLDMRDNKTYSFNILKADTTSYGAKRFSLVIRQNPAYAYRLLDFTAGKVTDAPQVQVAWKTENEQDYTNFTVERSIDNGKTFDVLGSQKAAAQGTYSILDKSPVIGQNLYRLKQEDINNTITYSKMVGVLYTDLNNKTIGNNLSIYPNPVSNIVNLSIAAQNTEPATYSIKFMTSSGVLVKEIASSQTTWQGNLSDLQPGIYIVHVINNKTQNLVGENKFVKL
ncbi:MAG: T9SS type A sorting domain-containing protein [Mucilaginibacter sp.]